MEKLTIKYEVEEAGWAVATITNESSEAVMAVSYLHDTLLDLAEMAISLKNGVSEAKAVFMGEPGEHQFIVTKQDDRVEYEVRLYKDWASWGKQSDSDYTVVLKGISSAARVIQQITQILWHIHQNIGPLKYKELWVEHDFPKARFKELVNV